MMSDAFCYSCGKGLEVSSGPVGRGEICPHCRNDVRVCLNCAHYDESAYNDCSEPMAERVVDKEKANFCDYFSFLYGSRGGSGATGKEDALKKLDELFKK